MLKSSGPPVAVGPPTQIRYDLFIDIVSVCFTGTLSGQLTLHTLQAGRPVHPLFVSIPFNSTYDPTRDPISAYNTVSDYYRHHNDVFLSIPQNRQVHNVTTDNLRQITLWAAIHSREP